MAEPKQPWTAAEAEEDAVSKKDLVVFLQENASFSFILERKLNGAVKNVAKNKKKDQLIDAYTKLFETKDFKKEGDADEQMKYVAEKAEKLSLKTEKKDAPVEEVEKETPRYIKSIKRKGDNTNFPRVGDTVACWYTGKLQNGTVFDTNIVTGRKAKSSQPLKFKVGKGLVIRGWDEALLTMSCGEKAEVTIEPEWAYGKKGVEGKVPPHSTLVFEVELAHINV